MTIKTPKFQGTHLWDRLCWAKENLEGKQSDYRIVWEDPDKPEECSKVGTSNRIFNYERHTTKSVEKL